MVLIPAYLRTLEEPPGEIPPAPGAHFPDPPADGQQDRNARRNVSPAKSRGDRIGRQFAIWKDPDAPDVRRGPDSLEPLENFVRDRLLAARAREEEQDDEEEEEDDDDADAGDDRTGTGNAGPRRPASSLKVTESRLLRAYRWLAALAQQPAHAPSAGGESAGVQATLRRLWLDRAVNADTRCYNTLRAYEDQWAALELFILVLYEHEKHHDDYVLVKSWHEGSMEWGRPISQQTLKLWFHVLAGNDVVHVLADGTEIRGRNLMGASVRQSHKAIAYFHSQFCRDVAGHEFPRSSHVGHPDVESIVKEAERRRPSEQGDTFPFITGVQEIRQVIFDDSRGSLFAGDFMLKLYVWFLFVMMLCDMFRAGDMGLNSDHKGGQGAKEGTNHCPDARTLRSPSLADQGFVAGCHGFYANNLIFVIRGWKGDGQAHVKPHEVRLSRNTLNPFYCPVEALMSFFTVSGLADYLDFMRRLPPDEQVFVPMFPRYDMR